MTTTEIITRTLALTKEHLAVKEIELTSKLVDDLNADSLDIVELCMATESEFEVEIMDEEYEKWDTVQDMVNTINSRYTEGG